jgi:hypothetical protein
MASPFTIVKGDEFTRLTPAGIIRCLQVQDRARGVLREAYSMFTHLLGGIA